MYVLLIRQVFKICFTVSCCGDDSRHWNSVDKHVWRLPRCQRSMFAFFMNRFSRIIGLCCCFHRGAWNSLLHDLSPAIFVFFHVSVCSLLPPCMLKSLLRRVFERRRYTIHISLDENCLITSCFSDVVYFSLLRSNSHPSSHRFPGNLRGHHSVPRGAICLVCGKCSDREGFCWFWIYCN